MACVIKHMSFIVLGQGDFKLGNILLEIIEMVIGIYFMDLVMRLIMVMIYVTVLIVDFNSV